MKVLPPIATVVQLSAGHQDFKNAFCPDLDYKRHPKFRGLAG
ncbi:MAG: hypothetical protein OXC07_09910 [Kistimonas sp.]|nr:hypothetical protein [Kistimonas sp.]